MYDLSGKVALITGAGGELGIGRAIATRLAREGADVIVNDITDNPYADRDTPWRGISSVVQEIEALGRQAIPLVADVSNAGQVQDMVRRGVDRFGHIDILVNNAAPAPARTASWWWTWRRRPGTPCNASTPKGPSSAAR